MASKSFNYESVLERDSLKICNSAIKKIVNHNNLQDKVILDAYLKKLIIVFLNNQPAKIHKKIFLKKKIPIIVFRTLEEKILTLELTKFYKVNIKFLEKIPFIYKIKNYFLIFSLFFIFNIFINKTNKLNKNLSICFVRNKSDKSKFFTYLKKFNRKKIYFSYNLFDILNFYLKNFYKVKKQKSVFIYSQYITLNKHLIKKKIYEDFINYHSPKSTFFFEGDSEDANVISYCSDSNNSKSICFQSGGFSNNTAKACFYKMNMNFFLTWGNYYKNKLQKINPKPLFINIGNPTIKKVKNKSNGNIVFLMQQSSNFVMKGEIKDLLKLVKFIRKKTDKKIIIRKHPNDLSNTYTKENIGVMNISIHDPKDYTLHDSLKDCDLALTIRSSAIIEAGRMGIIPLMLNNSKFRYEKNMEKLRYFNNLNLIGNYSQITSSLKKIFKLKNKKIFKNKIIENFKENICSIDILATKKISYFIRKYNI